MSSVLSQGPLFIACLLLMLGVVVIIHELGHYYAGRMFGAAAESFSIGFGKPIFERRDSRGTRWRINWIPLGGFVKFVGESQTAGDVGKIENGPVGKAFPALGVGARSVIALAGPAANFLLAILLFALILLVNGSPRQAITITEIGEGSPAAAAGFESGDVVRTIAGEPVNNLQDFLPRIHLGSGDPVTIEVDRAGSILAIDVVPERSIQKNGVGQEMPLGTIGVALALERLEPERFGPIGALSGGVKETVETVNTTIWMIGRMATGREPLGNLTGPVGIGDVGRRVVNETMGATHVPMSVRLQYLAITLVQICALVSVGIGFFNLLPLPVLDGGHLVFNAYEAVAGKALPAKVQEASLTVGLVLLLGMVVFVTWGDIIETGVFKSVGG